MKVEKTIKLDIPLIEDIIFISSSVFLYHAHHSCSEWQMNDLFNAVKSMCTYMFSWTGHWNQRQRQVYSLKFGTLDGFLCFRL